MTELEKTWEITESIFSCFKDKEVMNHLQMENIGGVSNFWVSGYLPSFPNTLRPALFSRSIQFLTYSLSSQVELLTLPPFWSLEGRFSPCVLHTHPWLYWPCVATPHRKCDSSIPSVSLWHLFSQPAFSFSSLVSMPGNFSEICSPDKL